MEAGGLSVTASDGDAVLRVLLHQAKNPSNPGRGDKGTVVTGAIGMISDFAAVPNLVELGLTHAEAAYALTKLGNGVNVVLDQHIDLTRG